jgi:hypothetical protein
LWIRFLLKSDDVDFSNFADRHGGGGAGLVVREFFVPPAPTGGASG